MAKISFNKLKLEKETKVSNVEIGGVSVEVKHYVPILDKLLAIHSALEGAIEYNTINRGKAEALLNVNLVMLYTNINFSKKERDNVFETYDILEKNGVIDTIVSAIPEIEYNAFMDYFTVSIEDFNKYKTSALGIVEQLLDSVPTKLTDLNSLLENFDPSKLEIVREVLDQFGGNEAALANEILGQK